MSAGWNPDEISFRQLSEPDLPLMHRWVNTPHVSKWWKIDGKRNPDYGEVVTHYTPRIQGKSPTKSYIFSLNNKLIGYIQFVKIDEEPEYAKVLEAERNTGGIDIFIGEEEFLNKGLGTEILIKFLKDIAFPVFQVDRCIIDPEPENKAAIRAYEKAGFKYARTYWNPVEKVWAYLMIIKKDAANQQPVIL